jgi:site-specific recombinase XerD
VTAAVAAAAETTSTWFPSNASNREWARMSTIAPQVVSTMRRYLVQLTTFLSPRSVEVADQTLRQFARWLTTATDITIVADIERTHVEDYKVWLAARPGQKGKLLAKNTQRHRLRMIRIFLERLIEWNWPDAPGRNPILHGDIPPRTEPIPRFLTDQQAAAFMAAARAHPVPRYRLVAQVLARTGLRTSELCELAADAVTRIGTDGYWLRVPVGKLRNDRMIPLHPEVVDLFADWTATNAEHIRATRRLLADDHAPIDRRTVHRIVARIGAIAGIDDMHPHRLRHTLATQAINRGMRLEAIAALLGHRSLEMTLVYAKITDRVVADEYASVCQQIDALYATAATPGALPADIETNAMARLRREAHARMLGNGMCTRPVELDCRMETICETCAYFQTGPEFVPVLLRQRDHARTHHQTDRASLYDDLITSAESSAS